MGFKTHVLIFCGLYSCLSPSLAATNVTSNSTSSQTNPPAKSFTWKNNWLGKIDPNSFSNAEDFQTKAISLKWNVNFEERVISGSATYDFLVQNPNASILILDTRDITVNKVISSGNGADLGFVLGSTVSSFGEPLKINVAELAKATGSGNPMKIEIHYLTSPNSTALQWLDPIQTAGKKHPYVFSQCEAIHARSLVPCQDTPSIKFAYNAEVSVPKELQALMSALHVGDSRLDGNSKIYQFQQNISIPSYLIAIAVGDIVSRVVGPRSRVWSETELVDAAAKDFGDTEALLKTAENILGEYIWGVYDILVLPPSFPYSGMENPCLTFVSSTLVVGDGSASSVIAHEVAHSWTGNLVTNKNWEHIWINEGFTIFAEKKIVGALYGEDFRQFESLIGWKQLAQYIEGKRETDPNTRLVLDLNGIDPHDAHSLAPVIKGATLLYYLEEKVGGPSVFEPYLRHYIQNNSYKSVDTDDFKSELISYFEAQGLGDKIADVDWNSWIFGTGIPPVMPEYDTKLAKAVTDLKSRWLEWDPSSTPNPFHKSDLDSLLPAQIKLFLRELLGNDSLSLEKIEAMEKVYDMSSQKSPGIRVRWIQLCLRAKWSNILPLAFEFVNSQGTFSLRPVYQDLYNWEEVRPQAIQNYKENSKYMMSVVRQALEQDLHLK